MNPSNSWDKLKKQYLDQIAEALDSVDDTIRTNILRDVETHLDQRRSELEPNQQTAERFGAIIQDMGPAHDYAELLCAEQGDRQSCDTPPVSSFWLCLNRLIDVVFVVLLFSVVAWTLSAGAFLEPSRPAQTVFRTDAAIVGNWKSVDFVENPDAFDPEKKTWTDELVLKQLTLYPDGTTSGPWKWTQGDIYHPGDISHAKYEIRTINGHPYLFFEWISGDVLLRHQAPSYYVLMKEVIQ